MAPSVSSASRHALTTHPPRRPALRICQASALCLMYTVRVIPRATCSLGQRVTSRGTKPSPQACSQAFLNVYRQFSTAF